MASLAFTRHGAGEPLVLLHGLGSSRHAWDPVVPALAEQFEVLAVDLPGFGDTPPLPADVEPHPAALAAAVASWLDELGIAAPHIAGHSLGGWIALELAGIRPVATLSLVAPAGLWRGKTPIYDRVSLRAIRWFSAHGRGALSHVVRYRLGRILVLGQTHGRPARVSPDEARAAFRDMGTCPGFAEVMRATDRRSYVATRPVDAPVTVAFGTRDRILLARQSRHVDELPSGTRVESLPGCGHVAMSDDPDAVAALIRTGARRAQAASA
jgi:pimeloyl-ACP methyl ester carboxylesterase